METLFSWLSMITVGYFMVMLFYSIPMVKNLPTETWLTLKLFSDYYSQILIDVNRLEFRKGLLSNYDVSFEQR